MLTEKRKPPAEIDGGVTTDIGETGRSMGKRVVKRVSACVTDSQMLQYQSPNEGTALQRCSRVIVERKRCYCFTKKLWSPVENVGDGD